MIGVVDGESACPVRKIEVVEDFEHLTGEVALVGHATRTWLQDPPAIAVELVDRRRLSQYRDQVHAGSSVDERGPRQPFWRVTFRNVEGLSPQT